MKGCTTNAFRWSAKAGGFNPDYAVETYCDLKNLAVPICRDFTILLLDIFINMPSAQNRSNFSFR
jgi:hypothetical protein